MGELVRLAEVAEYLGLVSRGKRPGNRLWELLRPHSWITVCTGLRASTREPATRTIGARVSVSIDASPKAVAMVVSDAIVRRPPTTEDVARVVRLILDRQPKIGMKPIAAP